MIHIFYTNKQPVLIFLNDITNVLRPHEFHDKTVSAIQKTAYKYVCKMLARFTYTVNPDGVYNDSGLSWNIRQSVPDDAKRYQYHLLDWYDRILSYDDDDIVRHLIASIESPATMADHINKIIDEVLPLDLVDINVEDLLKK